MAEELPTPEDETGSQPTESGLTPEEIAYMERVQKKRLVIVIIAGIVVLILGFLAGQNLSSLKSAVDGLDVLLTGAPMAPTNWVI